MKKTLIVLLSGFLFFVLSSCSKQNPVEVDAGVFSSLSGHIENWSYGSDCSASFIRLVVTTESQPDEGLVISVGEASIDGIGNFSITDITAPPDTLFNGGGLRYNVGLFMTNPVFFHGYTNPYISIVDDAKNFKGYLFYSNQSTSVLPYINENSAVGDYTMMYQYSDRDIVIDSSTVSEGVSSLTLYLTYEMSLKKGWNKIFAITTYVSSTERKALWTTTAPATPGKWYLCNRYFKEKQNLFK
jgi:hypothetical protein